MKQTQKSGLILILFGAILITGAFALLLHNKIEQRQAEQLSNHVLAQMTQMQENSNKTELLENGEIPEIEIDGERYIGCLNIPDLELELPVMSNWSYPQLKKAPCRYSGSIRQKNLVILGHRYKKHFGKLKDLKIGAPIELRGVDEKITAYNVVSIETVKPTNVDEVTSGKYELTLFTCTYSGKYRTVIHCSAVDSAQSENPESE